MVYPPSFPVDKIQHSRLLSGIPLVLILTVLLILTLVILNDPHDINEPTVKGAFLLVGVSALMDVINRLGFTSIPAMGVILPFAAFFVWIPFLWR